MRAILGNSSGKVKAWWLPFKFVFARTSKNHKTKTIVIWNGFAPNVWGLPIEVHNGKVQAIIVEIPKGE